MIRHNETEQQLTSRNDKQKEAARNRAWGLVIALLLFAVLIFIATLARLMT